MKLSACIIVLLCFVFGCIDEDIRFKSDCYADKLSEGVIGAYSFSQGSLLSETSYPADLSNIGSVVACPDRNGNPNCAMEFNQRQTAQYLVTPASAFLNHLEQFSISLWYQALDTMRPGNTYEVLIGRNSENSQARCPDRIGEWTIGLYDCRRAVFGHNNSVWMEHPVPPFASCEAYIDWLTGTWTHVVAVYNQDQYKLYINGILQGVKTGVADCFNPYAARDIGDLFLGRFFTGRLDDILMYNREITADEVLDLFQLEPCCTL